jgi:hypothetical protein
LSVYCELAGKPALLRANEMGLCKIGVGEMRLPVELDKCCATEGWVSALPQLRGRAGVWNVCRMYDEKNARRWRLSSYAFRGRKNKNGESRPQSPISYFLDSYFLHL